MDAKKKQAKVSSETMRVAHIIKALHNLESVNDALDFIVKEWFEIRMHKNDYERVYVTKSKTSC